ncbi:hypothetical protein NKH18_23810 [Streptomyces sp. M10(2022)]
MLDGIPNKAFKAVEGDDEKYARFLEKQNDQERKGQSGLFEVVVETKVSNTAFALSLRRIITAPSGSLREVHAQQAAYEDWLKKKEYVHARHIADAWCAAFMWRKTKDAPAPVTQEVFQALRDPEARSASKATHDEISELRDLYHFSTGTWSSRRSSRSRSRPRPETLWTRPRGGRAASRVVGNPVGQGRLQRPGALQRSRAFDRQALWCGSTHENCTVGWREPRGRWALSHGATTGEIVVSIPGTVGGVSAVWQRASGQGRQFAPN